MEDVPGWPVIRRESPIKKHYGIAPNEEEEEKDKRSIATSSSSSTSWYEKTTRGTFSVLGAHTGSGGSGGESGGGGGRVRSRGARSQRTFQTRRSHLYEQVLDGSQGSASRRIHLFGGWQVQTKDLEIRCRQCELLIVYKDIMPVKRRRRGKRIGRRGKRGQRGGLFPLLALIPAAIAAGKAAALGAVSGAAGYGIKKALAGKKKLPRGTPLTVLMRRGVRRTKARR